jgi:hypothetical protein
VCSDVLNGVVVRGVVSVYAIVCLGIVFVAVRVVVSAFRVFVL